MADSKFHGVIPPVVVPLDANRELDVPAFERSINRMIEGGVHGLFFLGSSGEVAFLNDDQRFQLLEEAVRIVDHRVPVLAGVIDMETERVIKQVKRTQQFGVDALVCTAPFYALGGPKENERHFRVIREHAELPLFAYDLPVCVHTKLDPTMLVRLGRDGVLAGVTTFDAMLPYVTNQLPKYKDDAVVVAAMREACHHNLYALANSSGMNGVGANTTVQTTRPTVVVMLQIIACGSTFFFLLSVVLWIIRGRKFRRTQEYLEYKAFKREQKAQKQ